jgi:hypothetical protein
MYDIMKKTIRRLAVKVQGLGMQSSVQMVAKSTEALNELQQKVTDSKLNMDNKMVKVNVINNLIKGNNLDVSA